MKRAPDQGLLNARDAAAELGVTVATLYAYVSRGLIRSELAADGRGRRYRAQDVQALRNRRAPPESDHPQGEGRVWDAPVFDSAITQMSEQGPAFRGALAVDLARGGASFEHVCAVLWDAVELSPFKTLPEPFPKPLLPVIEATATWPPAGRAAAVMALAAHTDSSAHRRTVDGAAATSAKIVRWMAALMAGGTPTAEPVHLVLARHFAPGKKQAPDLIRQALVLLADHELNPSTFAARVAASTGVSLYDAVAAGLAALKGAHHGGATTRAARFIGLVLEKDPEKEILARAALNEGVPGFGHPLYRGPDPRAAALLRAMAAAGIASPLIEQIPQIAKHVTGENPNTDYAISALARVLGFPEGGEIALLVQARTAGWLAHAREQLVSGELIRPRARYTGPAMRAVKAD